MAAVVVALPVWVLAGLLGKGLLAARTRVRRLESQARRRTEMLTAATQLTRALVAERSPDFAAAATGVAIHVVHGDFALLVVVPATAPAVVVNTEGRLPPQWVGQALSTSSPLMEKAIRGGSPKLLHGDAFDAGALREVVSVICVPLPGLYVVGGALVVGRLPDGVRFSRGDLELLEEFAHQLAFALELDHARASGEAERRVEDRSRMAVEANAQVITRLFTLSLELLSVAGGTSGPKAQERLLAAVEELDSTIAWLRESILGPNDGALGPRPLTRQVVAAVDEFGHFPGHEVRLDLSRLEVGLPAEVTQEAAAVVREVLKGLVHRVDSGSTDIELSSEPPNITVDVTTSGGYEDALEASVADHLRHATARGTLKIVSDTHDTCIRWTWRNEGD